MENTKYKQNPHHANGFTLLEMLVALAILLCLMVIVYISIGCSTRLMDKSDLETDARELNIVLDENYVDGNELPLGDKVSLATINAKTLKKFNEYLEGLDLNASGTIESYVNAGDLSIYEIDPAKLSGPGLLENADINQFYIIHSEKPKSNAAFHELERSLMTKIVYDTCTDNYFVGKKGTQMDIKASKQLNTPLTDDYILKPNPELSCELEALENPSASTISCDSL